MSAKDQRPGGALGKVVRSGVGRRRVQTFVMLLTSMLAVTASVLAAGLLVASRAPFEQAFAAQHGAHLVAQFDGTKVTSAQVAATAQLAGVTAAAGPAPTLALSPKLVSSNPRAHGDDMMAPPPGATLPGMTVVGRATDGGPVDDLALVKGRWVKGTGEIVLSADAPPFFAVGDTLTFAGVPGAPTLTVVGIARSMSDSADAWTVPAQLTALSPHPDFQMVYRFAAAATDAQLTADRAAVQAAVPAGALKGAGSYLKVKLAAERQSGTFVPFVVAFGVLGLAMSVLIIGVVVSGAVGSATRRIGILKSLGFTPAQVVRAYVAQALIPAVIGTGLGVVLGNLLAVPVLSQAQNAYSTGTLIVAPWLDVVVPLVALATAALAALLPALRAGRLRTVDALAVGRTPQLGRGRQARRLLGRLPLPRPVSLGLAGPFTRPARALTLAAAVVLGTTGVTFGVGLAVSLAAIQNGVNRDQVGDVQVQPFGGPGPEISDPTAGAGPGTSDPTAGAGPGTSAPAAGAGPGTTDPGSGSGASDPAAIAAKIQAQAGTRRSFGTGEQDVGIAGLSGTTTLIAYQGDSSWGSYQMVEGSWFSGPGQADVPSGFLRSTGTKIGDSITVTADGHSSTLRIVGEVFDLRDEGMEILTDVSSLDPVIAPPITTFAVDLKPGTDRGAYLTALDNVLQPLGWSAVANSGEVSSIVVAMDTLAGILTLMLVAVAGLGVLNTVLLDTRERVHDLGVFKALGMSPRQTIVMILCSVAGIGLVAGVVGVWVGSILHHYVIPVMGTAAGSRIPPADLAAYHPTTVLLLGLGGLVITTLGALLPAGWAAGARTAVALRTE